jgi:hypothetical protein
MEKCIYIYDQISEPRDNLDRNTHMRPQDAAITIAYKDTVSPIDLRIAQDDPNILVDIIDQSDRARYIDVTYRWHPRPTDDNN